MAVIYFPLHPPLLVAHLCSLCTFLNNTKGGQKTQNDLEPSSYCFFYFILFWKDYKVETAVTDELRIPAVH